MMSFLILCMLVGYTGAALHDRALRDILEDAEFVNHAQRVVRDAEADDYALATLYGKSMESGESRHLSKRDVELHASHPSTESRDFELHLTSGERLRMSLQKRSVMDSETKVVVHYLNSTKVIYPKIRDCIFSGPLKEKAGHASLWLCDGQVMGAISTPDRDFKLHPLPETVTSNSDDLPLRVLLTWSGASQDNTSSQDDVLEDTQDVVVDENSETVVKRSVDDRRVTVEVGVYVDRAHMNKMNNRFGLSTDQQFTDYIARKWSFIASVLHNPSLIGWEITIKVVNIQLWRENPSWYDDSHSNMNDRLRMLCTNTVNEPFDSIMLYTAEAEGDMGLSSVGGVCTPRKRCSIVQGASLDKWTGIHEFGHNLGLKHDSDMPECAGGSNGFMAGQRSVLRQCYARYFDRTFRNPHKGCLYTDNVDVSRYNPVEIQVS